MFAMYDMRDIDYILVGHSIQNSRCIKASICISEIFFNFVGGLERQFSWICFNNNNIFISFATYLKSSSFTTSRELRLILSHDIQQLIGLQYFSRSKHAAK